MNISKTDFGIRLMKLRKSKRLSMQELADITGVRLSMSGKKAVAYLKRQLWIVFQLY